MKVSSVYPGYPVQPLQPTRVAAHESTKSASENSVHDKLAQILADKRSENESVIDGIQGFTPDIGQNIDLRV